MGPRLGRRAVIAHLGNGASLAALEDGKCVDTTMAFTPASGVVMSTRPGDLDPGVLLYLITKGAGAAEIQRPSTASAVARHLGPQLRHEDAAGAKETRAAGRAGGRDLHVPCRKAIGAFAAALGGLDTLVLTGGIGENSPEVRAGICSGLEHLGLAVDEAANRSGRTWISAAGSRCAAYVIRTDEDRIIAWHARELLRG